MKPLASKMFVAPLARLVTLMAVAGLSPAVSADHELRGRNIGEGQALYLQHCASCHGRELEGQPQWRVPLADGRFPAPPHDASGHTWHHDNQLLFDYTKLGGLGAMRERGVSDFLSGMPAFDAVLTEEEIWNVLAYIQSRWPEDVQQIQSERNPKH